ncbi:MAG: ATP-binding protein [Gemmatimonadaceae bacterium]
MARWPTSLRAHLTLWFTIVLGVPLVAFAVISYLVFSRTLLERTDHFVSDALNVFAGELVNERRMSATSVDAVRNTIKEVRFRDLQIVILGDSGRVLARSDADAPSAPGVALAEPLTPSEIDVAMHGIDPASSLIVTHVTPHGRYRLHSRALSFGGEEVMVAGVYPLREVEDILARILRAFFVAIPLLLASAAVGGYFMAKRSLSPVSAMAAQAAEITSSNLHERLPVISPDDELGGLAIVVNSLLDRLERAFSQQRRFMADASHELRTPTAILNTEAQVTLSRAHREEEEYRESVTVMQGAAGRLTRIVDDLFLLARSDAGPMIVREEDLYLDDVVHDATRAVRPLAEHRQVRVELLPVVDAPFRGDADLLGRLLLNLLDNAIKFGQTGGGVTVQLSEAAERYIITVVDDGPGIPAADQERVFERFFRADPARSRIETSETSGAGLGLAIARRIAEAHGGELVLLSSRPGRTEFRITLPRPRDSAPREARA